MKLKAINLFAGICLLIVTITKVFEERETNKLEIEHGLLVFALAHVINGVVEMIEGNAMVRENRRSAQTS